MVTTNGSPRVWALASALREAREAAGLTMRQLAQRLKLKSHAHISHWESGARLATPEQVALILGALGTPPGERERILDIARHAEEPNWLTVGLNGIPQQLAGAIECERAASAIIQWAPMLIPGLLQTPDYTRAMMQQGAIADHDVELRVMVYSGRRDVLTRHDPVRLEALIGEAALYDPIGPPVIMRAQLQHLLDMSDRANITIRVVPLRVGWHPGLSGPFVFYEFPDSSPVLHFEHHSSGAFVPTEHDVAEYRKATESMRRVAKDPAESSIMIARVRESMEVTP